MVLVTVGYCAVNLHANGVSSGQIGRYGAYYLLAVLVPGFLVHKSLRGSLGSWVADLTMGAAVGLALELAAWMGFSLANLRGWLWLWPVFTLLVFAFGPARRNLAQRPDRPWPLWVSLGTWIAVLAALRHTFRGYLETSPLPPTSRMPYIDQPWHLGLIFEAMRSFPLQTPQVLEAGPLKYSWFFHAHAAASSMISGVPPTVVYLCLWVLPAVTLAVLGVGVLAERVSRRRWTPVVAIWIFLAGVAYEFSAFLTMPRDTIDAFSPTQLYSTGIVNALALLVTDALRNRGRRFGAGDWTVLVLLGLATTGTKSSAMSVVVAGLLVAAVMALLLRRGRRVALTLLALGAVLEYLALKLVTGGNFGSRLYGFQMVQWVPFYTHIIGRRVFDGTWISPGLFSIKGVGYWLFVGCLLVLVVTYARNLAFLLPLTVRQLRLDLAAWFLAGAVALSWGPFLFYGHGGFSEIYFMLGAIPFACVLIPWALAALVGYRRSAARVVTVAVLTSGAAALTWYGTRRWHVPVDVAGWERLTRQYCLIVLGALGAIAVLAVLLARVGRRRPAMRPLVLALLIGPMLASGISTMTAVPEAAKVPVLTDVQRYLQQQAAVWLRDHAPANDVVATNMACRDARWYVRRCDSRWWLVSGLGGHRTLLDGWAYTALSQPPYGEFADVELFDFNRSLFTNPTPQNLHRAHELGVRWLVASNWDPQLSDRLDGLATLEYANVQVSIYHLDP